MINRFEDIFHSEIDRFQNSYRYYSYSSKQGNSDSQRIIGDYYYYLWPPLNEKFNISQKIHPIQNRHFDKALYNYHMASKNQRNPNVHAMWNIGYMYQHGLGQLKSLDIAKRYFDHTYTASENIQIIYFISIITLYMEKFWKIYILPLSYFLYSLLDYNKINFFNMNSSYFELENLIFLLSSIILFTIIFKKQFSLGVIE
jgi:ERAD-associated E3 ubiquitin-protein ligase component HRD3